MFYIRYCEGKIKGDFEERYDNLESAKKRASVLARCQIVRFPVSSFSVFTEEGKRVFTARIKKVGKI